MFKKVFMVGSNIALLLLLLAGTVVHAQNAGQRHVVILVVDDFTDRNLGTVAEIAQKSPDELCYLNPSRVEGQAMADGMGGGEDVNGNPIPHGNLVLAEVLDMMNQFNTTIVGFGNNNNSYITAVPVEVEGYTVNAIASKIRSAITKVTGLYKGANPNAEVTFVINMSFALVPCKNYGTLAQLLADLQLYKDPADPNNIVEWNRFNTELTDLINQTIDQSRRECPPVGSGASAELMTGMLSQKAPSLARQESSCPLIDIFQEPNVIAVASAGNFGLSFPTLPAAWDDVVSVSGGQECDYGTGASGFTYRFNSAGGNDNRLVFQALTFKQPISSRHGDPCALASDLIAQAGPNIVYFSSSGEVMMPGLWDYVTALTRIDALGPNQLPRLVGQDIYNQYYVTPNPAPTPNPYPNFRYALPTKGGIGNISMGSSFAAPKLSFAIALYLAKVGLGYCKKSGTDVIGFKYGSFPVAPGTTGGPWNDYDLGYKTKFVDCDDFYTNTFVPYMLGLTVH